MRVTVSWHGQPLLFAEISAPVVPLLVVSLEGGTLRKHLVAFSLRPSQGARTDDLTFEIAKIGRLPSYTNRELYTDPAWQPQWTKVHWTFSAVPARLWPVQWPSLPLSCLLFSRGTTENSIIQGQIDNEDGRRSLLGDVILPDLWPEWPGWREGFSPVLLLGFVEEANRPRLLVEREKWDPIASSSPGGSAYPPGSDRDYRREWERGYDGGYWRDASRSQDAEYQRRSRRVGAEAPPAMAAGPRHRVFPFPVITAVMMVCLVGGIAVVGFGLKAHRRTTTDELAGRADMLPVSHGVGGDGGLRDAAPLGGP